MGIAAYYLTHEENMRKSFSQPSRSITRMLPDGTRIDYIMNDVVDCIRISPPQRIVSGRALDKTMTWDELPPFEEGTTTIDLSLMTEDPDVEGGYYCTVSVVNGTDESGRSLSAEFSVEMDEDSAGWSIEQGTKQPYPDFSGWTFEQFMAWYSSFEPYKIDGKSATLLLGSDVSGDCDIIARDGKTKLKEKVKAPEAIVPIVFTKSGYSIFKNGSLWKVGYAIDADDFKLYFPSGDMPSNCYAGITSRFGIVYGVWDGWPELNYRNTVFYNYNDVEVWNSYDALGGSDWTLSYVGASLAYTGGNITGSFTMWNGLISKVMDVFNSVVTEE